ncbi:MAG: hypothetical protein ACK5TH_14640, partial [Prosthecobacter sp.]
MKIRIKRLGRDRPKQDTDTIDAAPNQRIPVNPVESIAIDRDGQPPVKVSALVDGVLLQWADGFSVILVPEDGNVSTLIQRISDYMSSSGAADEAILHPYMMWTATWEDDPLDFAPLPTEKPYTLEKLRWDSLARPPLKTSTPPTISDGATTVSEEGLTAGLADAVGSPSDTTNLSIMSGTLAVSDPDGDPMTVVLGAPSVTLTSQGSPIVWTGAGSHLLTGTAGGTPVITVTITDAGAYTVTILGPVDHPDGLSEDVVTFVTPVKVTDSGGLTATGTLTVTIEDDSPLVGSATTQTVDEEGLSGNAGDSYASGDATG